MEALAALSKPWEDIWAMRDKEELGVYNFEEAIRSALLKAAEYDDMPTAMLKCLPEAAVTSL
eukprot:6139403-Amphidinium_carterae.1